MRRNRWLLSLAVTAMLAAACGNGDGAEEPTATTAGEAATTTGETAASGDVLIYTSVPENIINELAAVFEEVHPEINLEVFRATTGDVQARIATEQQAGGVQADLIWVAEPSAYESYKVDGLLAPTPPPEGAPIPEEFIDPDGFYVAGRVINMIVAWNTAAHPDGLEGWNDLLEVDDAVFPSPGSGAALAAIKGIRDEIDSDFFRTFADQGGTQVASNGAARDALISGEFGAAGVLDYMIRAAKAEGSPVDLIYPASGTVVIPSPIAITADASNPDAARVFVDFLLSQEGQQTVVEVGSFYPARTDIEPPEGAPPLEEITRISPDWAELVEEADEIDAMWSETFGG